MVLIIKSKIAALVLTAALITGLCPMGAYAEQGAPNVSAASCVMMYADGSCVYEKNADDRRLIASTTKLMTALICIENCELDEKVDVKARHCLVEGSSMYLKAGYDYTVRELLLGLLLASGNDAALALAEHAAGSERAFVRLMNRKAAELGMDDTSFANPHGLDDKQHYSTARDMAVLMLHCMENPAFRELCGTRSATINGETYVNHNRLLDRCSGCVAGKTGYTMAAGRCLVTCCERNSMRFVCVTLSDPDDWNDHIRLYDWVYSAYTLRELSENLTFQVPVVSGNVSSVSAVPQGGLELLVPAGREIELRAELPRFVFAPVNSGETAGTLSVIINGEEAASCPLVYAGDAVLSFPCFHTVSFSEEKL